MVRGHVLSSDERLRRTSTTKGVNNLKSRVLFANFSGRIPAPALPTSRNAHFGLTSPSRLGVLSKAIASDSEVKCPRRSTLNSCEKWKYIARDRSNLAKANLSLPVETQIIEQTSWAWGTMLTHMPRCSPPIRSRRVAARPTKEEHRIANPVLSEKTSRPLAFSRAVIGL